MKWLKYILFLPFLLLPLFSNAATISIGSDVEIEDTEVIEDNLYVVGGAARIFSGGERDVISIHGDGIISGEIFGDVLVVGMSTIINGIVHGDVRVIGGKVDIKARIDGDVVVLAGTTEISESADVLGDVVIISQHAMLGGQIFGHVTSLTNILELQGISLGNFDSTSNRLIVRNGTTVEGKVSYKSPHEAVIENGASLLQGIEYNQVSSFRDQALVERTIVTFFSFWRALQFITALIIIFLLVHVFKVFSKDVADYVLKSFFKAFTIGLLSVILIPIISIILIASIFAFPVGVILLSLYVIGLLISTAVISIYLGVYFKRITGKGEQGSISFGSATIALLVISLLQFIPYAGDIIRTFLAIVAFGGIIRIVYQSIRFHGKKIKF